MITREERELLRRARDIKARERKAKRKERLKPAAPVFKEGAEPRVQEPAYLQWLRRQPCVICAKLGTVQTYPTEAAHVRAGYAGEEGWKPTGMARRPDDWRAVPLCSWHHRDGPDAQHKASERAWWAGHDISPPQLCRELRAQYERTDQ